MKKVRSPEKTIDALLDAAGEAVMATSDREILDEAKGDFANPGTHAQELRAMAMERVAFSKRKRLGAARKALDKAVSGLQSVTQLLTVEEMKTRILELLPVYALPQDKLTLAFRKGDEMSAADMATLLEDLEELNRLNSKDS